MSSETVTVIGGEVKPEGYAGQGGRLRVRIVENISECDRRECAL